MYLSSSITFGFCALISFAVLANSKETSNSLNHLLTKNQRFKRQFDNNDPSLQQTLLGLQQMQQQNQGNFGNQGWPTSGNQGTSNFGNQGFPTSGNQGSSNFGNQGTSNFGNQGWPTSSNQGTSSFGNQGLPTSSNQGSSNFGNQGTSNFGQSAQDIIRPQTTQRTPTNLIFNQNTVNEAECIRNCPATNQWNPVCGSDNISYGNRNKLQCARQCGRQVQEVYPGSCVTTPSPNK